MTLPLAGEGEAVATFQDFGLDGGQMTFLTSIDHLMKSVRLTLFRNKRFMFDEIV